MRSARVSAVLEHVARPLRTGARAAMRAVPPSRRVKGLGGARGRRALQVRKLISPLLQRPVTLTTRDGLRLIVGADPVDEQIAQHILGPQRRDYFPEWESGPPVGACILDIGAHHGLYAAAALHTFSGSRIICVEPSAQAIPALKANLSANGASARARIVNTALASEAGAGVLRHTSEGSWGASLFDEDAAVTRTESVRLATLDEILGGERPQIVKCNAEGAEYSLFDQLDAITPKPVFMIIMVHPEFGDIDHLLAQAAAMHYRVTRVGTSTRPAFQMWHDSLAST